jgi:hypothetical protein
MGAILVVSSRDHVKYFHGNNLELDKRQQKTTQCKQPAAQHRAAFSFVHSQGIEEGFLMNSHQMEILQNSYYPRKFSQALSIHYSALELTNSPQGVSHPISVAMLFQLVRSLSLI